MCVGVVWGKALQYGGGGVGCVCGRTSLSKWTAEIININILQSPIASTHMCQFHHDK